MPPSDRRRRSQNGARPRDRGSRPAGGQPRWTAWLAPPIGAVLIVGLAAGASLAQSTEWIFIAASMVFSLCEGVVLAVVGYAWSRTGIGAALIAAVATAAVAAPARWEVRILMQYGGPVPQQSDLLADFGVSILWGAIAGLAGATILRARLGALMQDAETRFRRRR